MPFTIDPVLNVKLDDMVTALAISSDGSLLAIAEEGGRLTIRKTDSGDLIGETVVDGGISHLSFSAAGTLVVGGHASDLYGYDTSGTQQWAIPLGGGCDHLQLSKSGDLVAAIDGGRTLHLTTSSGQSLASHSAGELVRLSTSSRGDLVAVGDDQGNVTVIERNGSVRFSRPARGEVGERVTAISFLSDGHLCIAREALDVTMGDEDEIVLEWWNPLGSEVARVEVAKRAEVLAEKGGTLLCGLFDGTVLKFDPSRTASEYHKSSYSIHSIDALGDSGLIASWFHVHLLDEGGEESWRVEHSGLTKLVSTSSDGRYIAVGGDNENDYTRENEVMVLDRQSKPYPIQIGDGIDTDLADFADAPMDTPDTDPYASDSFEDLLTEEERTMMEDSASSDGDSDLLDLLESEETMMEEVETEAFDLALALEDDSSAFNLPPVADAGSDQKVKASDDGSAIVLLDGSASYDEDGDIVSYSWRDATNRVIGETVAMKVKLSSGNHTFTLTVTDDDGASTSDTVTVQVD